MKLAAAIGTEQKSGKQSLPFRFYGAAFVFPQLLYPVKLCLRYNRFLCIRQIEHNEQVIQHLLLLITESEKEFGEEAVCCQLVQLVGAGENDVEKVPLTELAEARQIHPQRGDLRFRYRLKLQRNIPAQVFMVTLPSCPACSTRLPQSENPILSGLLPLNASTPLHEFPA